MKRQLRKVPRTVSHSTSGTTASLLLVCTLTLCKCEVVHRPKNNPDCTEFFKISEDLKIFLKRKQEERLAKGCYWNGCGSRA